MDAKQIDVGRSQLLLCQQPRRLSGESGIRTQDNRRPTGRETDTNIQTIHTSRNSVMSTTNLTTWGVVENDFITIIRGELPMQERQGISSSPDSVLLQTIQVMNLLLFNAACPGVDFFCIQVVVRIMTDIYDQVSLNLP